MQFKKQKLKIMSDLLDDTNFTFTNAARIISATNGSLSAASSMLIMAIILRSSPEARTSAYHMIMFFMSFWDIMISIAMALNTIPMPSDVHDVYPFAGKTYGNVGTCEAQGFVIAMGLGLVLGSTITLNLYYVCTLRYGMAEEKFKRCILPVILILSMAFSVMISTTALKMDSFNPSPLRNSCFIPIEYPYGCNLDSGDNDGEGNGIECIRGGNFDGHLLLRVMPIIFVSSAFLVLVSSLVLVVVSVFDAELVIRRSRRIQQRSHGADGNTRSHATLQEIEFKRTRAVLIQALMYIIAFLLTWIWPFLLNARVWAYSSGHGPGPGNIVHVLSIFFLPLQGFFNAIIFVYQKMHTLRQTNARLNFFQAFRQVVLSPSTVPQVLVSSIGIILEEDIGQRQRRQGDRPGPPEHLTTALRQQIAQNSGMRRFGYGDDDSTPPPSISSGVGSSSLSQFSTGISMGDIISVGENESTSSWSGRLSFISQDTDATPPPASIENRNERQEGRLRASTLLSSNSSNDGTPVSIDNSFSLNPSNATSLGDASTSSDDESDIEREGMVRSASSHHRHYSCVIPNDDLSSLAIGSTMSL